MPAVAPSFDDAAGYERLMGAASRAVGSVFLEWLDPPWAGGPDLFVRLGPPRIVRTSLSTRTSTSFSSMPGSSAETRTSLSDAFTSRLGQDAPSQPGVRPRSDGTPASKAVEYVVEQPVHLAMKR